MKYVAIILIALLVYAGALTALKKRLR